MVHKDYYIGKVVFDMNEVPTRVPHDCPLALQWYKLEDRGEGESLKLGSKYKRPKYAKHEQLIYSGMKTYDLWRQSLLRSNWYLLLNAKPDLPKMRLLGG
ncbi:hypothetical protein KY290_017342 [Solanum tuberosum]|uniref:Uncharacterized protein n=1 Tax=Solanum tuberosum TaxID=4113 RepID=A0ABQ7VB11_SOLTU|nr:hypothetical protein KY290_017342 [Solanum tuberosum]